MKFRSIFISVLLTIFTLTGCTSAPEHKSQDDTKNTNIEEKQPSGAGQDAGSKGSDSSQAKAPVKGLKAMVVHIVDGDTIDVKLTNGKNERVRLILVDTPETKHPRLGVQPFGKEASAFTSTNLIAREVTLEIDAEERDQYGRLLAYVWAGDKLYNQILIDQGLARVAVYPPNTKYVDQFREAEDKARKAKKGIWSIENYAEEDGYHSEANETSPTDSSVKSSSTGSSYENKPGDDTEKNTSCSGKIKGNANSKIYHVPGGSHYESTTDNIVWFCSEQEAKDSGYRASKR
ncbi:micrococcal nuclease [Peribacillus deserti]|uniref:Micrococcal nuclease n=1 Tax=Peribacillus deserti TaxID=673318 RepID=A0ABS2QCR7_9BACI|nr:thermonuclease family protein [Peribacillus deserti]MBM7690948.1 micrococcal nuclease [Peribacillus deserti]